MPSRREGDRLMLAPPQVSPARSLGIPILLNAYQDQVVAWHCKLEIARAADTTFTTPIVTANSHSAQTGWSYRDEQLNSTTAALQAYPSGGVSVDPAQARVKGSAATVFYFCQSADLKNFVAGEAVIVRAAQSADQGSTWGAWTFLGTLIAGV